MRASPPENEAPEGSARNDARRRGTLQRTAMLAARRIALLGAGILGCRSAPTTAPGDGGLGWHTIDVTHREANVVVERVSYGGAGAQPRVFGQVCRPTGGATKHPVVVLNHGGFSGLKGDADGGLCVTLARKGYVAIEASYRGEDGSQGNVEACLGEVDDVLAMLRVALAQPYADGAHVGMLGSSHGGCVTLRALERGAPVRVAADGFGITDMARSYAYWQAELAGGAGASSAVIRGLVAQLDAVAGGSPKENAAAYEARSPIGFVSSMPATPLILVHGTADVLVSVEQSCAFAAKLGDVRAYHLDAARKVVPSAPAGCGMAGLTWLDGPLPAPAWPDDRYLVVYDGLGHEFASADGQAMALNLVTFVLAKIGG